MYVIQRMFNANVIEIYIIFSITPVVEYYVSSTCEFIS